MKHVKTSFLLGQLAFIGNVKDERENQEKSLVERDSLDVPDPEEVLAFHHLFQVGEGGLDDSVDERGEAENVEQSGRLFHRDHVPPVDSNARHSPSGTVALDESSHPPSDVDGEGGDEERRDELHDRQLGVVLALAPRQAQAKSSWSSAFRKVALDEEGEREDRVVDQDERT